MKIVAGFYLNMQPLDLQNQGLHGVLHSLEDTTQPFVSARQQGNA